jgi:hypothetical protein
MECFKNHGFGKEGFEKEGFNCGFTLPFLDADSFDKLRTSDTDLDCLFEIKLELAFEGLVEGFFILWPFVLGDWEWYYQIGGFLHRDISI